MFSGGARGSEDQKSAYWQVEGDYTRHFGIVLGSRGRGTLKLMRYLAKDDVPELFNSVKSHLLKAIGEWGSLGWLTEDDVLAAIRTPLAREEITGPPPTAERPETGAESAAPARAQRKPRKLPTKTPPSLLSTLERERQEIVALAQMLTLKGSAPEVFRGLGERADVFLKQTRDVFGRVVYPDAELTLDLLLGEDRAGGCVAALGNLGSPLERLGALKSCRRAAEILGSDLAKSQGD